MKAELMLRGLEGRSEAGEEPTGIHVASWRWDHVGIYVTITLFLVLAGLAKVGKPVQWSTSDCLRR
jgi:hypothetical protein